MIVSFRHFRRRSVSCLLPFSCSLALAVALVLHLAPGVRAARPQPGAAPFFFVQLSDPQFGMFTENRDFAQETINFEFAIATINRLRPAFVIVTGDLVNKAGDVAQIAEYRRIAAKIDRAIPLYNVAGNHDVENVPTNESLAAYRKQFGPDHYTFRHGSLHAIVLNSSLIHSPQGAPDEAAAQERWLRSELEQARAGAVRHLIVIQHHPWFIESPDEPDQYFNIPLARRALYLALFHEADVKLLLSGHYHRNALGRDGDIEMVTTGPVGKPLAGKSGIRIVIVRDRAISHQYYEFGEMPVRIDVTN